MERDDKLRLDYEQTTAQFRLLADNRFKLLAFVPTVSGAAIALLTGQESSERTLAVGLLGFFVTLGIVTYELRNTAFYSAVARRARKLEELLELPLSAQDQGVGGLFTELPEQQPELFGIIEVKHAQGLATVYGVALGGWIYVMVESLTTLVGWHSTTVAILMSVVFALAFAREFKRLSGNGKQVPIQE